MPAPHRHRLPISERAPDGTVSITITGEIGGWGTLDAEWILPALVDAKPKAIKWVIYSPGGYVTDAIVIAEWCRNNGVKSYAEVYGLAASAATVFMALAGPERTEIAEGSQILIHEPYGGSPSAVENAKTYLRSLYARAYGWTEEEAAAHMGAAQGDGELWTAAKAVELGMGKIMEASAVAARIKEHAKASEMTKTSKTIKAVVKLSTMDAVKAALGEGVAVEVEVDEATATAMAEQAAEIDRLTKEVQALKGTPPAPSPAPAPAPAPEKPKAEVKPEGEKGGDELAKAMQAMKDEHAKALEALKAEHAKAIADLKKPLDTHTVPNNTEHPTGTAPVEDAAAKAVKGQFFRGMTAIQKAALKKSVEARSKEKAPAQ